MHRPAPVHCSCSCMAWQRIIVRGVAHSSRFGRLDNLCRGATTSGEVEGSLVQLGHDLIGFLEQVTGPAAVVGFRPEEPSCFGLQPNALTSPHSPVLPRPAAGTGGDCTGSIRLRWRPPRWSDGLPLGTTPAVSRSSKSTTTTRLRPG